MWSRPIPSGVRIPVPQSGSMVSIKTIRMGPRLASVRGFKLEVKSLAAPAKVKSAALPWAGA